MRHIGTISSRGLGERIKVSGANFAGNKTKQQLFESVTTKEDFVIVAQQLIGGDLDRIRRLVNLFHEYVAHMQPRGGGIDLGILVSPKDEEAISAGTAVLDAIKGLEKTIEKNIAITSVETHSTIYEVAVGRPAPELKKRKKPQYYRGRGVQRLEDGTLHWVDEC